MCTPENRQLSRQKYLDTAVAIVRTGKKNGDSPEEILKALSASRIGHGIGPMLWEATKQYFGYPVDEPKEETRNTDMSY